MLVNEAGDDRVNLRTPLSQLRHLIAIASLGETLLRPAHPFAVTPKESEAIASGSVFGVEFEHAIQVNTLLFVESALTAPIRQFKLPLEIVGGGLAGRFVFRSPLDFLGQLNQSLEINPFLASPYLAQVTTCHNQVWLRGHD